MLYQLRWLLLLLMQGILVGCNTTAPEHAPVKVDVNLIELAGGSQICVRISNHSNETVYVASRCITPFSELPYVYFDGPDGVLLLFGVVPMPEKASSESGNRGIFFQRLDPGKQISHQIPVGNLIRERKAWGFRTTTERDSGESVRRIVAAIAWLSRESFNAYRLAVEAENGEALDELVRADGLVVFEGVGCPIDSVSGEGRGLAALRAVWRFDSVESLILSQDLQQFSFGEVSPSPSRKVQAPAKCWHRMEDR